MLLFLMCWLVVSVVVGTFVGKAIHRADMIERRRRPGVTASADASSSAPVLPLHPRAAWVAPATG